MAGRGGLSQIEHPTLGPVPNLAPPFRFAGTNLYWLGLDENVGGVDYPTYFRIRDALDTAKALRQTVDDLKPFFPQGLEVVFPYDTTPVVSESIKGVVETLVEAVVLVFLVMFLLIW